MIISFNLTGQLVYRVGSDLGWSPIFWFKAIKNGSDWSPRLAVYGDLGNDNSKSLPRLQEDAQSGRFDAIHHNGELINCDYLIGF